MTRYQGSLGGRRRNTGAVIQWTVIGSVLGFGCAAVVFFVLLLLGFVGIDPTGGGLIGSTQTAVVQIVTATTDPNQPTQAPTIITATFAPTNTQQSQVIVPTATTAVLTTETPTPDPNTTSGTTDTNPTAETAGGTNSAALGGVPPELELVASQLVAVQGGSFTMGTTGQEVADATRQCQDEGGLCETSLGDDSIPARQVTLSDYLIESTEVTYGQYVVFLNYLQSINKNHLNGCGVGGGLAAACALTKNEDEFANIAYDSNIFEAVPEYYSDYPVANVTWYGANAYCLALGRRLPTEAEWEHAARGPSGYRLPWGNDWDVLLANTRPLDTTQGVGAPQPAESFGDAPSPFGTLNQAGNVAEWVSDWYSATIYFDDPTPTNPTGPERGTEKVTRGGSWADRWFFARSVQRVNKAPNKTFADVGFRCADNFDEAASSLPNTTTNTSSGTTPEAGFTPPAGTPDPSSLGVVRTDTGSSAPTLAAPPTSAATNTDVPALPPGS